MTKFLVYWKPHSFKRQSEIKKSVVVVCRCVSVHIDVDPDDHRVGPVRGDPVPAPDEDADENVRRPHHSHRRPRHGLHSTLRFLCRDLRLKRTNGVSDTF